MDAPTLEPEDGMEPIDPNMQRVTGWLAVFCAGQIVIGPLLSLGSLVDFSESYAKLYPAYPSLHDMVGFTECIYLILAIFGIYSGFMVYNKRSNAIIIAKWYLLTVFVGRTVCVAFPFVMGLPPDFTSARTDVVLAEIVKTGATVTIWYAYLSYSKKVKAIFGNETSSKNALFYVRLVSASVCSLLAMSLLSSHSRTIQNEITAKAIIESRDPVILKSDIGKFLIALPFGSHIPEKKEEILQTGTGPITNNSYMVEFPNSAYVISYYDLPKVIFKTKSIDKILNDSIEGAAKASKLQITRYERFDFNGLPATRANLAGTIEGNIVSGRLDLVLSGGRMFTLFAIAKTNQEIEGATVRAFFDSFQIAN